uniref:Uncharacterized protein n=1 Tax=Oryza brachyantha TaxID=4533 RepID=J3MDP4_ORYBR
MHIAGQKVGSISKTLEVVVVAAKDAHHLLLPLCSSSSPSPRRTRVVQSWKRFCCSCMIYRSTTNCSISLAVLDERKMEEKTPPLVLHGLLGWLALELVQALQLF